jgi:hypothetical protein
MLAGKIVPVSLGTVPVLLGQGNDGARFAGWKQPLGLCQNSEDDLAWRSLMEYAYEKHLFDEE